MTSCIRRVLTVASVAIASLALVACEKSEPKPAMDSPPKNAPATPAPKSDSSKSSAAPAAATDSKAAAAPTAAKKKYRFGILCKSNSNPVFQAAHTGAKDAGVELAKQENVEIEIIIRTPPDEDAAEQAKRIEQLVSEGVDGIAVSVTNAAVLTGAIDKAVEKGVPVCCFDSDAPASKRFAHWGMDDEAAGKVLGEQLVKAMGDKGVVAILAGNQNATNLQNRVKGVRAALSTHSGITIKNVYYHPETAPEAVKMVQQTQGANPDITGWAMVGGWPLFTENALAGVADKGVKVVSVDTLPAQLVYVRSGQVQALVGQNCYGWGYESVRMLLNKAHKNQAPSEAVQKATIDVVTKDNVEQFAGLWEKWLGGKK